MHRRASPNGTLSAVLDGHLTDLMPRLTEGNDAMVDYALDGIRVIDLSQHFAGPGTCMYLADQGADVIKVEPPGRGDAARQYSSTAFLRENSRNFLALNRNKRSIALDIRKASGRAVLTRLIEQSDVLIHNLRRGAVAKLGLGYDELQHLNPRLIYGWITAYGPKGPYADRGGYDRMTQGFSGAMYRKLPDGTPLAAGVWISDASVPMLLSYGVMLALWVREKTGLGQKVETSLLQAAIAMQQPELIRVDADPSPPEQPGGGGYGGYLCGDGVFINVGTLQRDQFQRFCLALDLPHLADDPRYSQPGQQGALRAEMYPVVEAIMKTKTSDEWLAIFDKADVPCAPILERSQVFDEPQMLDNGYIIGVDHPQAGQFKMMGIPLQLSMTPGSIRRPPPLLGQHTDEILREHGYADGEIDALKAEGAI